MTGARVEGNVGAKQQRSSGIIAIQRRCGGTQGRIYPRLASRREIGFSERTTLQMLRLNVNDAPDPRREYECAWLEERREAAAIPGARYATCVSAERERETERGREREREADQSAKAAGSERVGP